ncbi:MAG: hypothetical protein JWO56_3034, partial [Acidobacteria bacterium]|nr:hypothetical protein [Acidobacteriota bacterium]
MKRCPSPMSISRARAASIAAFLLVLLFSFTAHAQFQTGNIRGKVLAKADGSALPGVTVTLSGIGAPQTFISDSGGDFRFLNLSPGTYQVTAELSGFAKAVRSNVTVSVGQSSEAILSLAPATSASITVTASAPLIDTRKTGTGQVVTREELEQIPTGRDPWVIMGQAPGVQLDRVNVGGSESGQQDVVVARGASDTQKTFNLDGVNITDVGATGSTPTYYDFDSFEEIQVTTGGSDPRIQTPGAQINMVTKRGTNEFLGTARYLTTGSKWQSTPVPSGEAARYLVHGNQINSLDNYSGDIGGPIWRDKAWFWGSYAKQDIKLFVGQPWAYSLDAAGKIVATEAPLSRDNTILKDWNAKVNFQPLANNNGTYLYTYGNKLKFGRGADPLHPPETTENQNGPTHMYKVEDTHIFNQNLYVTALGSHVLSPFSLLGVGGQVQPYIDENGVWHRSGYDYTTRRPQSSYRADGSYFFKTGGSLDHELKFGFGYRRAPVTSTSIYPTTGTYGDFSQTPCGSPGDCAASVAGPTGADPNVHVALLTRPGVQNYVVRYADYYLGDTITTGNLTIQGGLRFDRQNSQASSVTIGANSILSDVLGNVTIPADVQKLKWNSVSPRLGFTYTLPGSQRTLVRGSYNHYVDQLGGNIAGAGNPYNYANGLYYYWKDANADKTVSRNELLGYYGVYGSVDPDNPNSNKSLVRLDYHMKVPKTDEIILGVEREVMSDLSVGIDYSYRKFGNFWWNTFEKTQGAGDYVTAADFDCSGAPLTGVTPGGKSFSVPNCSSKVPLLYRVITTRPGYTQTYNGLDLYATKRMSNRWMMRGSFSWNDRKQHIKGSGSVDDPTNLLS